MKPRSTGGITEINSLHSSHPHSCWEDSTQQWQSLIDQASPRFMSPARRPCGCGTADCSTSLWKAVIECISSQKHLERLPCGPHSRGFPRSEKCYYINQMTTLRHCQSHSSPIQTESPELINTRCPLIALSSVIYCPERRRMQLGAC